MPVLGIIPARLQSTRLPRKLLLAETGHPLIEHTWQAAEQCQALDDVIVATDSQEIAKACGRFGGQVVMTGECENGTARAAAALEKIDGHYDCVVNIQGDEPEIDPRAIETCVQALRNHPNCEMATLANPITSAEQLYDAACVKVVLATNGQALYFSRAPIPFSRDISPADWFDDPPAFQLKPWLQHIGLYAYRTDFLRAFVQMPPSPLEQLEQLEQLRALQAGAGIHVTVVADRTIGIDTPADYEDFVRRYRETKESSTS